MNKFDKEYVRVANTIIHEGYLEHNERTGKMCAKIHGDMMKFDLANGEFPLLTLRKMHVKGVFAELLGFIRGFDNAAKFRELGCNLWNANANDSKHWLENSNRKGEDDLGRIYGVQARNWLKDSTEPVDQLKIVVDKISKGIDDRRLIVTHWNPGELDRMALPPCHLMYQFGLRGDVLDLAMYQRSCDVPLGVPSNIASYALLLRLIAQITGKKAGVFTHFLWNAHIYEDQIENMRLLLAHEREGFDAPTLTINSDIKTLEDLETWVTVDDFKLYNYKSHSAIKFPFAE